MLHFRTKFSSEQADEEDGISTHAPIPSASAAGTAHLNSVCVVDDDHSIREALCSLLKSADLQANAFASAPDLLNGDSLATASCLVVDLRLPELSGLELQSILKSRDIDVPIVFMSGYSDIATTERAMRRGAVHFLEKPFREQQLLDAVFQAISPRI